MFPYHMTSMKSQSTCTDFSSHTTVAGMQIQMQTIRSADKKREPKMDFVHSEMPVAFEIFALVIHMHHSISAAHKCTCEMMLSESGLAQVIHTAMLTMFNSLDICSNLSIAIVIVCFFRRRESRGWNKLTFTAKTCQ